MMSEIGRWLNDKAGTIGRTFTYNSINKLLKNRRYIGEFKYRDILVPDGVPQIVPTELFDRVQEKMGVNKKAPARKKAEDEYLLTTKLICGKCGAFMCGESGTGRSRVYHYYKCVNAKNHKSCTKKTVKKDWIEDFVIKEAMKIVMDDKIIKTIVEKVMQLQAKENTTLPLYEKQLREVNLGIQNVLNAIQQGILTKSTKTRLEQLEQNKEDLEIKIANEKLAKPVITAEFVSFFIHKFRKLDVTKLAHKKMLIDTFVNSVVLFDDKLLLTFNYKNDAKSLEFSDLNGSSLECSGAP